MRISIVYASQHGQTRKIAEAIAKNFLEEGGGQNWVELLEVSRKNPNPFIHPATELILIGAPVYVGKFPKALLRWTEARYEQLKNRTLGYFTVSLNVADTRPEARAADDRLMRAFIKHIGVTPAFVASFAGALNYSKYGWLKRWLMKRISASAGGPTDTSKDYEMTDWKKVNAFAKAIMTMDHASEFAAQKRLPVDMETTQAPGPINWRRISVAKASDR